MVCSDILLSFLGQWVDLGPALNQIKGPLSRQQGLGAIRGTLSRSCRSGHRKEEREQREEIAPGCVQSRVVGKQFTARPEQQPNGRLLEEWPNAGHDSLDKIGPEGHWIFLS